MRMVIRNMSNIAKLVARYEAAKAQVKELAQRLAEELEIASDIRRGGLSGFGIPAEPKPRHNRRQVLSPEQRETRDAEILERGQRGQKSRSIAEEMDLPAQFVYGKISEYRKAGLLAQPGDATIAPTAPKLEPVAEPPPPELKPAKKKRKR